MNEPEFRPGECQETTGFLFAHRCGDVAVRECQECQKPICQQHSVDSGGVMRCVGCEKKLRSQQQNQQRPPQSPGGTYYDDSPYFYGSSYGYGYDYGYGRHRHHYHHHHHHSTDSNHHEIVDADEAALSGEEVTAEEVRGFEDDLGAS